MGGTNPGKIPFQALIAHKQWHDKTAYNISGVHFCRFSDIVHEATKGREGEDLLRQSEPGRRLAPREGEYLQWPWGLAGIDFPSGLKGHNLRV